MKKILFLLVAVMAIATSVYAGQGLPRHPTVTNTTLGSTGGEYAVTFPSGTGDIKMQSRTGADFQVASMAISSNTTFYTVKSGTVYAVGSISTQSVSTTNDTTLYLKGSAANQVIEVLYWN